MATPINHDGSNSTLTGSPASLHQYSKANPFDMPTLESHNASESPIPERETSQIMKKSTIAALPPQSFPRPPPDKNAPSNATPNLSPAHEPSQNNNVNDIPRGPNKLPITTDCKPSSD